MDYPNNNMRKLAMFFAKINGIVKNSLRKRVRKKPKTDKMAICTSGVRFFGVGEVGLSPRLLIYRNCAARFAIHNAAGIGL
jgi:hypothetical protein